MAVRPPPASSMWPAASASVPPRRLRLLRSTASRMPRAVSSSATAPPRPWPASPAPIRSRSFTTSAGSLRPLLRSSGPKTASMPPPPRNLRTLPPRPSLRSAVTSPMRSSPTPPPPIFPLPASVISILPPPPTSPSPPSAARRGSASPSTLPARLRRQCAAPPAILSPLFRTSG